MLSYTLIPMLAAILGAVISITYAPTPRAIVAFQHLAAGVVFAAAAGELLPEIQGQSNSLAIIIGGTAGIFMTFGLKMLDEYYGSAASFIGSVAFDTLIDGFIIGLGFVAGAKQGLLLTIALTIEVLFLGLALTSALSRTHSNTGIVIISAIIGVMLPIGAWFGFMAAGLPPSMITAAYTFGLIALLYLVTEELLVEAHAYPQHDSPLITSLFFIGFLGVILLEQQMRH
jgi:ZIP family zinc transporter